MKHISHTAAYIAVKFYGLTLDEKIGGHFDPAVLGFYEKMVRFLPKHLSWYHDSLTSPVWRKFFILSEEALLPGDLMHIISRKYYITKKLDESLKNGIEQVVIPGSGFDHLGAYVSGKGVPAFELDTELMTDVKQRFINQNGYQNEHLELVVCDVTEHRVKEELEKNSKFDPGKKTLFVTEGFFDYLSPATSEEILEDIRALNPKNQLLTTFFSLDELNLFHRFVFTSGVSLVGETLKFKLELSEFVEFLEARGYLLGSTTSHRQMKKNLISASGINLPVLKGFYIMEFGIDS